MSDRPNFLFIMTDQHRADHLGCYGNSVVQTPSLDSIASGGIRFDRFHVANPICMPNRASIMTGRMPSLHGVRHNGISLSLDDVTFVELLRDAGYRTALIGKSHLQSFTGLEATRKYQIDENKHTPSPEFRDAVRNTRRGKQYDLEVEPRWNTPLADRIDGHFYGFEHVEVAAGHADETTGDYLLWARSMRDDFDSLVGPENALSDNRINAPQAWRTAVPEQLYPTSWVAQQAQAYLAEQVDSEQPFFLKMSFPDPHHPFTPPGKYWDMYDPDEIEVPETFGKSTLAPIVAMQAALSAGADKRDNQNPFAVTEEEARQIIALTYGSISMIDDAIGQVLKQLDTLGMAENTIVIFTSDHGDYMGDHGIMLKLLLHFQGLIRVPFLWNDPTDRSEARVNSDLASSIDIATTILERAGIQPYNGIQGRDLMSSAPPEAIVVEEDSQRSMIGFERLQRVRTVVTDRYRMSLRQGEQWGELYDLEKDPNEMINLFDSADAASIKAELSMIMLRKTIELQDQAPLPAYRA